MRSVTFGFNCSYHHTVIYCTRAGSSKFCLKRSRENMLSAEMEKLAALVDATSTELSSTRDSRAAAVLRRHQTKSHREAAVATGRGEEDRSVALALPTRNAITLSDLKRAFDARVRRVQQRTTRLALIGS